MSNCLHQNDCMQSIFLHEFCLCMQLQRVIKGKIYPINDSPVHGKHDDENCSSVPQFVRTLQPFL